MLQGLFARRWQSWQVMLFAALVMHAEMLAQSPSSSHSAQRSEVSKSMGPLRVHPENPRYFTADGETPVFLAGSHEGWELQDNAWDVSRTEDFVALLDLLDRHGHNVLRMWVVEHTRSSSGMTGAGAFPMPFQRTGPGTALDGAPRFDLKSLNDEYFQRLRARVEAARERGIYVIVMLFQGVSIWDEGAWFGHYLNGANNISGIDADKNGDGLGYEAHALGVPAVTEVQEAYVRRVVETLAAADNVLYEIANEDRNGSVAWQEHWIRFVRRAEKAKVVSHPVGMTVRGSAGTTAEMLASSADWISIKSSSMLTDPPPNDGSKVVLLDTDHFRPYATNWRFAFRALLRGHNVLILDRLDDLSRTSSFEDLRATTGQAIRVAARIDLARMTPLGHLTSTGFCLADPGTEYLAYIPSGRKLTLDLSAMRGNGRVTWIQPITGLEEGGGSVLGGAVRRFRSPFRGGSLLHVVAHSQSRLPK